jgi:hypothetical protein
VARLLRPSAFFKEFGGGCTDTTLVSPFERRRLGAIGAYCRPDVGPDGKLNFDGHERGLKSNELAKQAEDRTACARPGSRRIEAIQVAELPLSETARFEKASLGNVK